MTSYSLATKADFVKLQTIVVKIGTSSLTRADNQLAISTMARLVETLSHLQCQGHRVILVSSGAVGVVRKDPNEHNQPPQLQMTPELL
ncbi:MAG: hypothetical protein F6K11_11045, partial [Leptolyngbya sp. SIO3F4]|nr:hypothetical protein [Leptolyngbya sp. SIO3F4]